MAAFYRANLEQFLADDSSRIIGSLASRTQHTDLKKKQIKAWEREVRVLKAACHELASVNQSSLSWSLLLEYPIPRRHKRLDAVLLSEDVIFCLEFKTEDAAHTLQAQRQVEDYALDLRDFHAASSGRRIVPVVVVPKAPDAINRVLEWGDPVCHVLLANETDLPSVIHSAFSTAHQEASSPIVPDAWDDSPYRPVPTIIEAATGLYAGHQVTEIAHSHAGAINVTTTADRLVQIIQQAKRQHERVVCFVTGVPGAGKTLAGLSVVHHPTLRTFEGSPVFLSGNGPLVRIVSEAISQDHKRRKRDGTAGRIVGASIQNVHAFVREGLEKPTNPPFEKVVIFDEAQRAWDRAHNFAKTKTIDASEPETVLSIMDRHKDWAVIVALVGCGQEIHSGEAGLAEWGQTLRDKFPHWTVAASPLVLQHERDNADYRLFADDDRGSLTVRTERSLHLEINLRSFRAREYSRWVDCALAGNPSEAYRIAARLNDFPFALTRSLSAARLWLRTHARGEQRAGLVASSGALRLRAEGIELSSGFRQGNRDIYTHWFLKDRPDIRSSSQLEVVATEFECQGLELDWIGLCWGGDFTYAQSAASWRYRRFKGAKMENIGREIDRRYLLNKYRVLLTRARRGLILWVPEGDADDATRPPNELDETYQYLLQCGVAPL